MRKAVFYGLIVFGVLFYYNTCEATLISYEDLNGDKVVYDSTNDQYWRRDLSYTAGDKFGDKMLKIASMNSANSGSGYYGLTNWSMALLSEITPLWNYSYSEITTAFIPSNTTTQDWYWWSGSYNEYASPTEHYNAVIFEPDYKSFLSSIYQDDNVGNNYQGAWIVATNVNPVPEPATMFLLGSMFLGIYGARKKMK